MFSASSVKQLLANQDKQTKTEHGTTVGKEHVKESQGEMVGVQEFEPAAPLELCESNEGYLTEHALLADSAPPFARGAPFLYRKFTVGSIIAFQFFTEKPGSASVTPQTDKNGTTEGETSQQKVEQRRE